MEIGKRTLLLLLAFCLLCTAAVQAREVVWEEQEEEEEQEDTGWWQIVSMPPRDTDGHWSETLFSWARRMLIIDGYREDGTYRPDRLVTEAEFLKMLYRSMGLPAGAASYNDYRDWTDSLYSMALTYNYPVKGAKEKQLRSQPLTRQTAAELLIGVQGLHYTGEAAQIYLITKGLANREIADPSEFGGEEYFSRAEALSWIRQHLLRGAWKLHVRPTEPSDPVTLPVLSKTPVPVLPDFSLRSASAEDFDLWSGDTSVASIGAAKASLDAVLGAEPDFMLDWFDYLSFDAKLDSKGHLQFWLANEYNSANSEQRVHTYKGIAVGVSTLSDVIEAYGTAGIIKDHQALYYYLKNNDGSYTPFVPDFRVMNLEKIYTIAFGFDPETQLVTIAMAGWLPYLNGRPE
ncbi:hypothetical protein PA598K_05167 [Paenibacillus sp. 598K]|uniref:S-layer homology domain-containing protein n=1 Tax=Paenibacillus sp. 598K TaxID=1117987 RepID=UPI000FFA1BCB|nr:S-layer homology domain-containing protein [Paenibacillus sp. 598K]GBF76683.1 hypothetical protein PA598K_05167 [Paenibacillus sp. 598K]